MAPAIWTICQRPNDYPDCFVATEFRDGEPTGNIVLSTDLELVRQEMFNMGLTPTPREDDDPPKVVENWSRE